MSIQNITNSESIIFYHYPHSANSAVVRAFLSSTGIEHTELDAWGKTREPEFMKKFPTNLCPALEHGEVKISESATILRYLCRAFPDKAGKYYPTDDIEKAAKIDMLLDYTQTSICALIPKVVHIGLPPHAGDVASLKSTREYFHEAFLEVAEAMYELLETKYGDVFLKKTKYLLSDEPTIADFRFAPSLNQIRTVISLPPRVQKYFDDMNQVPGFEDGCADVIAFTKDKWQKEESLLDRLSSFGNGDK